MSEYPSYQDLRPPSPIPLASRETERGSDYFTMWEWNLPGNYPKMDRARDILGVRPQLNVGPATYRAGSSYLFELNSVVPPSSS
jgi:hypothetical protein